MFTIVDARKFENYFYTTAPLGEWHRDIKKLPRQEGVFGLCFTTKDTVFLARDLVGAMPLYFLVSPNTSRIYISNAIADLREYPEYEYPFVHAVPPRYVVAIDVYDGKFTVSPFYTLPRSRVSSSCAMVARHLRNLLKKAVNKMLPRGKIGVLLSGGSDSFTTSYLLSQFRRNFTAYTLTVDGKGEDLPQAKSAARFLKVPLTQVDVSSSRIFEAVEDVVRLSELYKDYDVYMAVGSYFLARALKKDGIKNVFTGDGANELFGDYGEWGSFSMSHTAVIGRRFRRLMVFGRGFTNRYYNRQLGSGLGKSLSRLNKVFFHYGIKVHNPFLDREVVEYLLALPKSFLQKYTKQDILRCAFPEVPPYLFPPKIRLQDGAGITSVLRSKNINETRIKDIFNDVVIS